MRIISILTALVVMAVLYGVVIERDRLLGFARDIAPAESAGAADTPASEGGAQTPGAGDATPAASAAPASSAEDGAVAVIARHSTAQEIDDAVLLRGQSQAFREVDVLSETTGRVISEPLPKGSAVTADIVATSDITSRLVLSPLT